MAASDPPLSPDEGFALLLVLWTMALLSLFASQVTAAGRAETKLANALRSGAQLRDAADGRNLRDDLAHAGWWRRLLGARCDDAG